MDTLADILAELLVGAVCAAWIMVPWIISGKITRAGWPALERWIFDPSNQEDNHK
jgi:hypothetical protein